MQHKPFCTCRTNFANNCQKTLIILNASSKYILYSTCANVNLYSYQVYQIKSSVSFFYINYKFSGVPIGTFFFF